MWREEQAEAGEEDGVQGRDIDPGDNIEQAGGGPFAWFTSHRQYARNS
jgi:hypothetical protein